MKCILCASPKTMIVQSIAAQDAVKDWLDAYKIDITGELKGRVQIDRYQCATCGLEFFDPSLAGSDRLYEQLGCFPWYYMPTKWEHDVAIQALQPGWRVLEVGCGRGAFVGRMRASSVSGEGIDLNGAAVSDAVASGLPVSQTPLEQIVAEQASTFDAVCTFQVLEHVPDPAPFLTNCLALLKPGGKLIISVPNCDGFIRHDRGGLLNAPPHHISRWGKTAFTSAARLLHAEIEVIRYEPLAAYHLSWYANVQVGRVAPEGFFSWLLNGLVYRLILPPIRWTQAHNRLQGHSIYVCYRKSNP